MAVTKTFLAEGYEANSSPQGSVTGSKGNKLHDTVANKVYESLGGTDWRLVEDGGFLFSERRLDKFSDLSSLIDLKEGEYIKIIDRNNRYKVLSSDVGSNAEMQVSADRTQATAWWSKDIASPVFTDGDFFEINVKIPLAMSSLPTDKHVVLFQVNNTDNRISYSKEYINGVWQPVIEYGGTGGAFNDIVVTDYYSKEVLDKNNIPFDTMLNIRVNIGSTVTYFSTRGFGVGYHLDNIPSTQTSSSIYFKSLNLNGDIFESIPDGTKLISATSAVEFDLTDADATTVAIPTTAETNEIEYTRLLIGNQLLDLEIVDNKLSPQMLGYDTSLNINREDNGNYASDLINFIELSKYQLYLPAGIYNLDKSIDLITPQSLYLSGGNYSQGEDSVNEDKVNRTEFYTYSNIDFFRIFSGGIFIYGGFINATKMPYLKDSNNAAFKICSKEALIMNGGVIDTQIVGNAGITRQEGGGIHGVYFSDTDSHPTLPENTGRPKEVHSMFFRFIGDHLHTCLLLSNDTEHNNNLSGNAWSSKNRFEIISWKCKRAAYISGEDRLNQDLRVMFQAGDVLHANEIINDKLNCAIYLNSEGNRVEASSVDMGTDPAIPDGAGFYRPNVSLRNFKRNILTGRLADSLTFNKLVKQNYPLDLGYKSGINRPYSKILEISDQYLNIIDDLDDILFLSDKKFTVNVNFYSNNGSFDQSYTNEAVDDVTNITKITDDSIGFFSTDGISKSIDYSTLFMWSNIQPRIMYTGLFSDDDIVEIVIEDIDNLGLESRISVMAIAFNNLVSGRNYPLKVQLISPTENKMEEFDLTSSVDSNKKLLSNAMAGVTVLTKLIFRFIGVQDNTKGVGLNRLLAKTSYKRQEHIPFLNIQGDQKIYGDLEVETLTVPTPITSGTTGATDVAALETKLNTLITELKANFKS